MPYKTNEEGHVVLDDGKPVFVKEDGTETAVDFENLVQTVNSTNSESKARKEKIRDLEKAYGKFKDFEDTPIEDINKALEIMRNLDQKELVKAGERDEAIRQAVENTESKYKPMITGYEQKLNELTSDLEQKKSLIERQVLAQTLSNSPYLDKVSNTSPDVRQTIFANNFRIEEINGQLKAVAYKADGEKLYSPSNPAQLCDTEEALQILWNAYPHKDLYSKMGNSGSGSTGNAGGPANQTFSRLEWQQKLGKATVPERKEMAQQVLNGQVKLK